MKPRSTTAIIDIIITEKPTMAMLRTMQFLLLPLLLLGVLPNIARGADPKAMFVIRQTDKSPEALVAAIEKYADKQDWVFLGADKIKFDEVTLVKVCIPEIGGLIWPQGMHLSALLPCGNLGIYRAKNGKTEVSMLRGAYMHALVPTPAMKKASDATEPLFNAMLEAVLK